MEVIPLKNKVLVQPKESEEKTAGGIYIPDTAKEKTQEGVVIAAGEPGDSGYMPVKKGDHVLYESYAGSEIEIEGKKHLILKVKDILGIIKRK
jgi:chaperonin GroES